MPSILQSSALDHWTRTSLYSGPLGQYGIGLGAIAYGNGRFVTVGQFIGSDFGYYGVSTDGLNWTTRPLDQYIPVLDLFSVTYANGLFVAAGWDFFGGNNLWTSSDGLNWTVHTNATVSNFRQVIFGGSLFVAVGDGVVPRTGTRSNRSIYTSPDGTNWTARTPGPGNHEMFSVAYGSGRFLASDTSGNLFSSTNGGTWTWNFELGTNFGVLNFCSDRFIATTRTGSNIVSFDGLAWSSMTKDVTNLLSRVVYSSGVYIGLSRAAVFVSSNAATWSACSIPAVAGTSFTDVAFGPSNVVVTANENPQYPMLPVTYTSDPFVALAISNSIPPELLVTGLQGRFYRLEYTDSLQNGTINWQALGTVCLTNPPAHWQDATTGRSQRFYRAVLLP